ncbi:hypothetical protein Leryth_016498 [Lithospermum erythrorhizon]|nr:hypothetical protein Leryth_016498 [Lithospermum erythrorhizon]
MRSLPQRPTAPGYSILRKSFALLFITIFAAYVLYSSKVILKKDTDCAVGLSTEQKLESADPFLLANSTLISSDKNDTSPGLKEETNLTHIVFGIAASAKLWSGRKEYVKQWWRPGQTRGIVWLDNKNVTSDDDDDQLPEIRVSENTSDFRFTNRQGTRYALRLTRIVSETFRLGLEDVKWFVMGDDDTVFVVDNLIRVLQQYDHNQLYYIGSVSESHIQNIQFSYVMAFGGGGFAISYPLAKELEKMQDKCIQRYPALYGSDDRIQACMSELGVPLTKNGGFHQYDVYGNLLGLLAAHPVTPFVTMHHLDVVQPIFPDEGRVESVKKLLDSARYDSASLIQQSICYDQRRYWSISVSWGYVVQIVRGLISPREMEMPARTFLNWYKRADYTAYAFNTRPVMRNPCQKPFWYYKNMTRYDKERNQVIGIYKLHRESHPECRWKTISPAIIDTVVVMKTPDKDRWQKSPRRDCCRIMQARRKASMTIWIKNCDEGEFSDL